MSSIISQSKSVSGHGIRVFDFSYNNLSTESEAKLLAEVIKEDKSLKEIDLSLNPLRQNVIVLLKFVLLQKKRKTALTLKLKGALSENENILLICLLVKKLEMLNIFVTLDGIFIAKKDEIHIFEFEHICHCFLFFSSFLKYFVLTSDN